MDNIIPFSPFADEPEPQGMTREELTQYARWVREQLDRLDEDEPEDMSGEDYDDWADRHEELEDLADEIQECLEELGAFS